MNKRVPVIWGFADKTVLMLAAQSVSTSGFLSSEMDLVFKGSIPDFEPFLMEPVSS